MFGTIPVFRFSMSVALLLTVALFTLTSCRSLYQNSPTPAPVSPYASQPVPTPTAEEQKIYSAFRPIMPGEYVEFLPSQTEPIQIQQNEPPKIVQQIESSTAAQLKIDELSQKIAELEIRLAQAEQTLPSPPPLFDEAQEKVLREMVEEKPAKILPIINRPGVHVYADATGRVRINIMDKFLFVPNAWQLSAEGEETLRAIAAELRAYDSKATLDIEGHTDSLMSDPNNPMQKHDISVEKTTAVMSFFMSALRWDSAKIGTSNYGHRHPIDSNGTPEGRERNNRIEIVLTE